MLDDFKNQQVAYKIACHSILKNRLGHAYLIEANGCSNAFDFALAFAKMLLCENHFTNASSCTNCFLCKTIEDGNYPDLKIIRPDGMWIKKEQLEELQKDFSTTSTIGTKKIYIITDASKLNASSANSILKFLEEPAPNIIAILLADYSYQILDTILSRCQVIPLHKNSNQSFEDKELQMKSLIAHELYQEENTIKEFIEDSLSSDKIKKIVQFLSYYEANHLKTLSHINHLFFDTFKEKNDILLAFQLMILYYKDMLNFKLKGNCSIFLLDYDKISVQASSNSVLDISEKLDIIMELQEKLKINANSNLLLDQLIIRMEGKRK